MAEKKKAWKGHGFGEFPATLSYKEMRKAFATPGEQPGERNMALRIATNRGVTLKKARAIGRQRTARGVSTAGIAGPKDMKMSKERAPKKKDPAKGRGTNKPTSGLGPGRERASASAPKADKARLAIPKEVLPKPKPRAPVRTTSGGSRKAM